MSFYLLWLMGLGMIQEEAKNAREWAEQLGSPSIEVREEATEKLIGLGEAAVEALRETAKGENLEAATRAGYVLEVIRLRGILSERLRKALPGVERRLARRSGWLEAFLEAIEREDLLDEDVEALLERACGEAKEKDEKFAIIKWIKDQGHAGHLLNLVGFLKDEDSSVRGFAARALGELGAKEAVPGLVALLKDENSWVRQRADIALITLRSHDGVPILLKENDTGPLFHLNALRRPELSERLRHKPLSDDLAGPWKEVLKKVLEQAELKWVGEKEVSEWSKMVLVQSGKAKSVWDALVQLSEDGNFEFILEEEMRILNPEEARTFWNKWWEEREAKK